MAFVLVHTAHTAHTAHPHTSHTVHTHCGPVSVSAVSSLARRQQFKACQPLVEQILKSVKQAEGLQGPLQAEIWCEHLTMI